MLRAMISILLLIILAVGTVLLEIYLAKKPSRWPGLVLPVIFFPVFFHLPVERRQLRRLYRGDNRGRIFVACG